MTFGTAPSIKLRVSEEHEFYVQGDTIRGDVLVAVLETGCHIHSLSVIFECIETSEIVSIGKVTFTTYTESTDLLSANNLVTGCHTFAYTFEIPRNTHHVAGFPPSFELDDKALTACGMRGGIRWSITAELIYGQHKHTIEDTANLKIFPLPSENDLLLINARSRLCLRRMKNMDISVVYPYRLPQSPNLCDIEFKIRPDTPTYVHTVEVCLERTVVMWVGVDAKVFFTHDPLEIILVKKVVDELDLCGASRQWQIKGPLPSEFTTARMSLHYSLYLRVKFANNEVGTLGWVNSTVAPAALIREVPKSMISGDACAPPPYSETQPNREAAQDRGHSDPEPSL